MKYYIQKQESKYYTSKQKKIYFTINMLLLIFWGWLTFLGTEEMFDHLSNIKNIKDNGVYIVAKVVDVENTVHHGKIPYTTYKHVIIDNNDTKIITLNHKYLVGKNINVIYNKSVPSMLIEGKNIMGSWDLYKLNYQRSSVYFDFFLIIAMYLGWLYFAMTTFRDFWWL